MSDSTRMEPSKEAIEAALLLCPEFKGNVAALTRAVEKILQVSYAIDFAALRSSHEALAVALDSIKRQCSLIGDNAAANGIPDASVWWGLATECNVALQAAAPLRK